MKRLLLIFLIGCGLGVLSAIEATPGATSADWLANPEEAAKRAGATAKELDGLSAGVWAALATGTLAALAMAKRFAPLISRLVPVYGPMIEGLANMAWTVAATTDQKAAERARDLVASAAHETAPILVALRAIPPEDLPPAIREMLSRPIVRSAIDHLANGGQP